MKLKQQKSWFAKHPIWTGIIFIFILFFILLMVIDFFIPEKENFRDEFGMPIVQVDAEQSYLQSELSNYNLVTRIIDGDTIEIEGGERVRLICIDTPERGERHYREAKDYLEDLILNKEIKLVKDISERDKYNRLLRYIYTKDGIFVNELIVRNGYAKAYLYKPDTTLCPEIQIAENIAKDLNRGIWAENEVEESNLPDSPEDYICDSNFYNCVDFKTKAEAQDVFEVCGGLSNDIHRLDRDNDGLACETLG